MGGVVRHRRYSDRIDGSRCGHLEETNPASAREDALGPLGIDGDGRDTMVEKLTESEVEAGLVERAEWSLSGDSIQRTFTFGDFLGSIDFVNRIGARAEEVQHHPDILIRYAKVTLTLSTHDAGGLSEKDFAFAADCDRLYAG